MYFAHTGETLLFKPSPLEPLLEEKMKITISKKRRQYAIDVDLPVLELKWRQQKSEKVETTSRLRQDKEHKKIRPSFYKN